MEISNYSRQLDELYSILKESEPLGFNFGQLYTKIAELKKDVGNKTIRLVLISSFSDGKTSTIAGLLGRIEDNMKIDSDESSDEVVVYHPKGLQQGFEIVDTPGLFGTKEKEINGKSVRFSEITEKYISQAHIILYVCDAVTPLKESHAYVISKLMRDYNKLDSTIFVINKMDEAGFDPTDETDFARGVQIKSDNLKKRLRDTIGLTEDEEKRLHIVCICADPKGKGINKWFETNPQGYVLRSHIEELRKEINNVIAVTNRSLVLAETNKNTIVDLTLQASEIIQLSKKEVDKTLASVKEKSDDIRADLVTLRNELMSSKREMANQLDELENQLVSEINAATPETIGEIVEKHLGINSENVDFSKLERKINNIVSACGESNNFSVETNLNSIEKNISIQDELLQEGLQKGVKAATTFLKNTKVSGDMIKGVRDIILKSYKFKPWGAINLANKLNRAMPWISVGLDAIFAFWQAYKEKKQAKEFAEMKSKIKDAVKQIIKQVFDTFKTDEDYYTNYAPAYLQLEQQCKDRQNQLNQLTQLSGDFDKLKNRLSLWLKTNAEDVEFVDITNN